MNAPTDIPHPPFASLAQPRTDAPRRAWLGCAGGVALFLTYSLGLRWLCDRAGVDGLNLRHALLKFGLIALALLIWRATRRPWPRMGWARPRPGVPRLRWYLLAAAGLGLASIALVFLGYRHPLASKMRFFEVVLSVWLLSSVAEEIYVRGCWQSWMSSDPNQPRKSVAAASAALFAGMHVPLLWTGPQPVGGAILVAATFVVGWAAAELRARTGSLADAIGVHVFGNVAAVPCALLGVLLYRLIHGQMPPMVG